MHVVTEIRMHIHVLTLMYMYAQRLVGLCCLFVSVPIFSWAMAAVQTRVCWQVP